MRSLRSLVQCRRSWLVAVVAMAEAGDLGAAAADSVSAAA